MEEEHQNSYFWAAYVDFMMILFFIAFGLGAVVLTKYQQEKKKVVEVSGEHYKTKKQNDSLVLQLDKYISLVQEADRITAIIKKEFDNNGLKIDFTNNKKIKLEGDYLFETGSALLKKEAIDSIILIGTSLMPVLQRDSNFTKCAIIVEGHADSDGDETENYNLSCRRAYAIVKIWADSCNLKLPDFEILPVGFGESQPYNGNTNATKDERTLNRRIEIAIAPKFNELLKIVRATQVKNIETKLPISSPDRESLPVNKPQDPNKRAIKL